MRTLLAVAFALIFICACSSAQESPYFVTYSHRMEEPGNLEVAVNNNFGVPKGVRSYTAPFLEVEYGMTAWWTSELYLEGQTRRGDSPIFTGWRYENRFRPLAREHRLNPVLYLEFEDINEGSLIRKEIVGHADALDETNDELRRARARELETKLILSSNVHDWNISENFIFEKNLTANEGFEFGYAFGVSRPLARVASGAACRLCRENFAGGLEVFGGLGSTQRFGFADTAHYIAPAVSWQIGDNATLRVSPAFGVTGRSDRFLLRLSYSYEIQGFRNKLVSMLRGK